MASKNGKATYVKPRYVETPINPARRFFTTGQVATLLGCSPKTVCKHIDSKRLRGFRIPGGQDRRVSQESLISFMQQHGIPTPTEFSDSYSLLLVGVESRLTRALDGPHTATALSAFEAGRMWVQFRPRVIVIDGAVLGMAEARNMGRALGQEENPPRLILLLPEDLSLKQVEGFHAVLTSPADPETLAQEIDKLTQD